MNINQIKMLAILFLIVPLLVVGVFKTNSVAVVALAQQDDTAAMYKSKCAMCHKPTAEKFFDPAKADDALVEVVLKGKKAEKPPNMPAFEEKGMTKDQANQLVKYMRQVKTAPPQ